MAMAAEDAPVRQNSYEPTNQVSPLFRLNQQPPFLPPQSIFDRRSLNGKQAMGKMEAESKCACHALFLFRSKMKSMGTPTQNG